MEDDLRVNRFVDAFFPYVWFRHNVLYEIPKQAVELVKQATEFTEVLGKVILHHSYVNRFELLFYFSPNFEDMISSRENFMDHLTKLCERAKEDTESVFDQFIATSAIVAEAVFYCLRRNHREFFGLAPTFWIILFNHQLRHDFYAAGGWEAMKLYIKENNLEPPQPKREGLCLEFREQWKKAQMAKEMSCN